MDKELTNIEIKCLDHGFVRLVDYMGSDSAIVQAARVSYGEGTKKISEDKSLIRYLMRNKHTSPFEMVEFKFHVKLPIFIARQWIRHRTANVNEYSGRYSEMKDECYLPEIDQLRKQGTLNKQGSSEDALTEKDSLLVLESMKRSQTDDFEKYKSYLDLGIAREISRINLPLSTYTEWYWKIDLHNLFHFLRLRLDHHAQYEIRVYGEAIAKIIKEIVPIAYEAFEDYTLNCANFSRIELTALKAMIKGERFDIAQLQSIGMGKSEAVEFLDKTKALFED